MDYTKESALDCLLQWAEAYMLPGADDQTKLRISLAELLAHMCPVAQNTHISSTPRNFFYSQGD